VHLVARPHVPAYLPACPPARPLLQVYLAKWRETLVAVKVLLATDDNGAAKTGDSTRSFSSPVLEALQKVRSP
jgi:hypothetical protein